MNTENQMGQVFDLRITNGMLYDRLHRYAAEYSLPVEKITELAIKRFVDDIELYRDLRTGKIQEI